MGNPPIAVPFKDVAILAKQKGKCDDAVEGAVIDRVVLVDRIKRHRSGSEPAHSSLPGHLVQLTVAGTVEHESEGRLFEMAPGLVAWFYQDEEVHVKVTKAPWSFFTVNFIAPHLPPPPFDQRVRRSSSRTRRLFEKLLERWRDGSAQPLVRHMQVNARLLDLLSDVLPAQSAPLYINPVAQVWWKLEEQLRERLQEPVELSDLCRLSGRSARTLSRACHRATGLAPMKRIKKMRLSMARGLVLHSELNISEVAYRVGYDRVQELCRDYRSQIGCTPMEDRQAGPDYRRIQPRCQI
jgi:AraC-like DNA-binding protein